MLEYNQQPIYNSEFQREAVRQTPRLKSGIIWYVCFLPLIGLFLENYCVSKWAGLFLWAAVIFMMILSCIIDCRYLKKLGADTSQIKKWVWLAPMYVLLREKMCLRDFYKGIMLVFFCAAALIMNGFTQGTRITTNTMSGMVQNSYVQNLDNFSGTTSNIIGEQIAAFFDDDTKWDCTKSGEHYYVTCDGKKGNDSYVITFDVNFDGFTYLGYKIESIAVNGTKLENEQYKDELKAIFIDDISTADSTLSEESSTVI